MDSHICIIIFLKEDKLFDLNESNIMKFGASEDELVEGDWVEYFTIDELSRILVICIKNFDRGNIIIFYLCRC